MPAKLLTKCILLCLAVQTGGAHAQDVTTVWLPDKKDFHLFILAGQSNMAGRGEVDPRDQKIPIGVLKLSQNGDWIPAIDPIHYDKPIAGVGPGRSFGITIARYDTTITIGLIPCAVGGSSITAWQAGSSHEPTQTRPYDDCIDRAKQARKDGILKAVLWHQGESDSNKDKAPKYKKRLYELVGRFRNNLNLPMLPFIAGQLGNFKGRSWNQWRRRVNQAHQSLPENISNTAFVSSEGLTDKGDLAHFDAKSARELGKRYAEAYLELIGSD